MKTVSKKKLYLRTNVYEAALDRMRYIFDEFEEVVVSDSGGKDSSATLEIALTVAREKGRLPLKVMFLDQECEWQSTIDTVKRHFAMPDVEGIWICTPIGTNASSSFENTDITLWGDEDEERWVRPKPPGAVRISEKRIDWYSIFPAVAKFLFGTRKACMVGGVRCEESANRLLALTQAQTYKKITYGKKLNPQHDQYTFYPLYDWLTPDIWKLLLDRKHEYNALYDFQFRHGVGIKDMRVSSVIHEQSIQDMKYMHEFELETYNRIVNRVSGANSIKHLGVDLIPKALPLMFTDWKQYRDYLVEKLITNEEHRGIFHQEFARTDFLYGSVIPERLMKVQINSIIVNDYCLTKLSNLNVPKNVYKIVQSRRKRYQELKKEFKNGD